MSLIGFLAPDGVFTECEHYEHMIVAVEMIKTIYNKGGYNGVDSEQLLYKNGYIGFTDRNVCRNVCHMNLNEFDRQNIKLTDEQRNFIVTHLEDANNDDQKRSMLKMLEWDTANK